MDIGFLLNGIASQRPQPRQSKMDELRDMIINLGIKFTSIFSAIFPKKYRVSFQIYDGDNLTIHIHDTTKDGNEVVASRSYPIPKSFADMVNPDIDWFHRHAACDTDNQFVVNELIVMRDQIFEIDSPDSAVQEEDLTEIKEAAKNKIAELRALDEVRERGISPPQIFGGGGIPRDIA